VYAVIVASIAVSLAFTAAPTHWIFAVADVEAGVFPVCANAVNANAVAKPTEATVMIIFFVVMSFLFTLIIIADLCNLDYNKYVIAL
jgi:hypothetical protein